MIKTFAVAFVCVASVVSMAQGPDVRFGGCGSVGRLRKVGQRACVAEQRQLCRHAPGLDRRRQRVGRSAWLDLAAHTALDRHQPGPAARYWRQPSVVASGTSDKLVSQAAEFLTNR